MLTMSKVPIVDIYWEGPFEDYNAVSKHIMETDKGKNSNYYFYQIYGDHVSYGRDVLLYIGISEKGKDELLQKDGILDRLKNHHNRWTAGLCSEIKIYIGSYGLFSSWENWKKTKYYSDELNIIGVPTIKNLESLLIYAHRPSINCMSKMGIELKEVKSFRIFNTGRRRSLLPEISTTYYLYNNELDEIVGLEKTRRETSAP